MNQFEERRQIIKNLKPIDDVFFEVLIQDKGVFEEIARTILQDPKLEVIELHTQETLKNLQGRSVRLDAFCKRSDGAYCNIEVQKTDNDDHIKRVRYNEACITANVTPAGAKFKDIPDVYMIYLSRFDMFDGGKTIYHIDKTVRELNKVINDGVYEMYVNTKVDDGSEIADLMRCFEQDNVKNDKFPKLTERVSLFKETEEGERVMCKAVEDYAKKYAEDYAKKYVEDYAKKYAEDYAKKYAEDCVFQKLLKLVSDGMLCAVDAAKSLNIPLEKFNEALNGYKEVR